VVNVRVQGGERRRPRKGSAGGVPTCPGGCRTGFGDGLADAGAPSLPASNGQHVPVGCASLDLLGGLMGFRVVKIA